MSPVGLYPTQDDLRLEVEEDLAPGSLENLIPNPAGELGGWGWRTPTVGSTMIGTADTGSGPLAVAGRKLIYRSPGAIASAFTSEAFAVAASEWVAASWVAPYVAGFYRARIEWLNVSGGLISSSTQTGYLAASASTVNLASVQAPALTTAARLRFDHYSTNLGAVPSAGQQIALQAVTAAKAAGALGTTRTNLIPNPSFEVVTDHWGIHSVGSSARVTTPAGFSGTACLRGTAGAAGDMYLALQPGAFPTHLVPVVPAKRYVASGYARAATTGRVCRVGVWWYKADGTYLSQTTGTNVTDASGGWVRSSSSGVAPASAAFARVFMWWSGCANGEIHYMDAMQLEQKTGTTPTTYLDGSLAAGGGTTYAWTGTAHDSPSTAATTTLDFVEPISYLDILGPTHEIRVAREELNLGTLNAVVLDAALDPSQGGIVRPGKVCRLSVWVAATSTWETLFTGEITKAEVLYHLQRTDQKKARITLEAVDNAGKLATVTRKVGVAAIGDLPYVLEGAGVPWDCNGNGNQVPSATAASTNDQASALDQVAVTRDSRSGYAWVDRFNVLRAYDADKMPSKNWLPNGRFEVDASGWTTVGGSFGRLASVPKVSSTPVLEAVCNGGIISGATFNVQSYTTPSNPGTFPVTAGNPITLTVEVYVPKDSLTGGSSPLLCQALVEFDTAAGALVTPDVHTPYTSIPRGVWKTLTMSGVAPALAELGVFKVLWAQVPAVGTKMYFRNAFVGAEPFQVIDEAGYSDLDVGFDTEQCVNQVNLKYLRLKAAAGTTEEIPYGPYQNADSVERWGPRSADFTVHGIAETGPALQAFADKILALNAEPLVRANAARVPIRTAADLPKAILDLYGLAYVRNASLALDNLSRISRVEHNIQPGAWITDLGFVSTGSVAAPQVVPSPNVAVSLPPYSSRYIGANLAITNSLWEPITCGTVTEHGGMAFTTGGTWTIERAGLYLLSGGATFATGSTGRRIMRTMVGATEVDRSEGNGDDANDWTLRVCKPVRLAVGDTVQFQVHQTSGAVLNLNLGPHMTHCEVTYLGD